VNLKKDNIEFDILKLGCLFYSAATKEKAKPNDYISLHSLTEINNSYRSVALNLIKCLSSSNPKRFKIKTLLLHPLFTQCSETARSKLTDEVMKQELGRSWKDEQKLQDWIDNLEQKDIFDEELEELKEIVNLKNILYGCVSYK
jgi:serine/threonine protein kinase